MHKSCHLLEGERLIPIFDQVTAILILAIVAGGGGLAPLELSHLCRARVDVQPLAFTLPSAPALAPSLAPSLAPAPAPAPAASSYPDSRSDSRSCSRCGSRSGSRFG